MDTATKKPRHASEISGSIRQRVEWLLKRNEGLDEQSCVNYQDALRIGLLLDELDSVLLLEQLNASLRETK